MNCSEKLPKNHLEVRLIAFDLDDTLLTGGLSISPRTVRAVRQAASSGIYIVLCSGRTENAILPYVRTLDIAGSQQGRYLIGINGASIFDLHKRVPIYQRTLQPEIQEIVYSEAKKRNLPAQVYDPSTIYVSEDSEWTRKDARMCGLAIVVPENFSEFIRKGFPKILVPADEQKIAAFMPELKVILDGKADVFTSKPYFLEIMPKGCGKGSSVLWLAEHLGIPKKQTMAFGDSLNDESMITETEYGVAMKNGLDYIKEKARFITRFSNDEDGIADFLESFVL